MSVRVAVAVFLVGLNGAWNAGNVGPVVDELASEFDLSLALVGVLSGTLFLLTTVIGLAFAPRVAERLGLLRALRISGVLTAVGNLLFALAPGFAVLALGRVLPGLAFSLVNTAAPVWARNAGGVALVGVLGASIQLAIALALLVGSGLSDLDVDWRVGFLISAALGVLTVIAIPRPDHHPASLPRSGTGFLAVAVRRARVYRLALLFVSIYGVPMILGSWLIQYLLDGGDVAKSVTGVAAFLLFGLSAAVRVLGAELQSRGVPHLFLCATLAVAAIGLAALALEPTAAAAFAAVVLMAVGFGIPYSSALTEAQDLYPEAPAEPVALMTVVGLGVPAVAIPLFGHALSSGDGRLAFGLTAAFLAIATLANLRRTGIPLAAAPAGAP